jgi:hypothetical protein
VGEAAQEQPIDAVRESGEKAGACTAAVDDRRPRRQLGRGSAEPRDHGNDVFIGGGFCSANGPMRLVRDHDSAVRSDGLSAAQRMPKLTYRFFDGGISVEAGWLAEAYYRDQPVPQGGRSLGRDDLLGLTKLPATFRVSDLGIVAAGVGQHGSGDLAGLVADIVRGDVLAADRNTGAGEDVADRGQCRECRKDEQLDAGMRPRPGDLCDGRGPSKGVPVAEVGLQADPDGDAHRRSCVQSL